MTFEQLRKNGILTFVVDCEAKQVRDVKWRLEHGAFCNGFVLEHFSELKGKFGRRICAVAVKGERVLLMGMVEGLSIYRPENLQWTELYRMEEDNG